MIAKMLAVARWFFKDVLLWPLLTIIIIAAFFFLAPILLPRPSTCLEELEQRFRLAGLMLQLAGFVTVLWGLRGTRKLFGIAGLFQRFPGLRRRVVSASVTLAGVSAVSAVGTAVVRASEPIEERVRRLEARVDAELCEVKKTQAAFAEKVEKELSDERELRESVDRENAEQLRDAVAGNIQLSHVGLWWFVLGMFLSGLPLEIAKYSAPWLCAK